MKSKIQPRNMRQQVNLIRKKRDIIFLIVCISAFLIIFTNLIFGEMGLIKYIELTKTEKRLKAEIVSIEKEKRLLESQVDALRKDPFYIEKHAREEFGLAKPDEYIFQFQNDDRK